MVGGWGRTVSAGATALHHPTDPLLPGQERTGQQDEEGDEAFEQLVAGGEEQDPAEETTDRTCGSEDP